MKTYEKPFAEVINLQAEVIMTGEELVPLVDISGGVELD